MLRWLYIQLLRLHPAPFRWQFGDDMLDDFDRAALRAKPRYFADAVASLARQWLLRPEFRHSEAMPATSVAPLFQTIEAYKPRPAALVDGGFLAMLSILVAVELIGRGGGMAQPFLIGAHASRPSAVSIDRSSITASDLNTTVDVGPDRGEAGLRMARSYFASMPILRALDIDRDLTLSPQEVANAPTALRILASNHDGKLTAGECGLRVDPSEQLRRRFMNYHPVLSALDADHDGEISAREIDRAAASLKKLDRNHDGYVSADELIPSEVAIHAGQR